MIANTILRLHNSFEMKFQMKPYLINKIMKPPQIKQAMN